MILVEVAGGIIVGVDKEAMVVWGDAVCGTGLRCKLLSSHLNIFFSFRPFFNKLDTISFYKYI